MKIIISDFDCTFFTNEYLENIRLINKFVSKGNMFIIATGRNLTHLKKDISGYNIDYSYLICNDGGVIFDKTDTCIYRQNIDDDIVKSIFDFLNKDPNNHNIYIDDSLNYVTDTSSMANAIISQYNDYDKALETLNTITSNYPSVHGYLSENWINITNKVVNKANGIKELVKLTKINSDDIYTIGDNINDLDMIKEYHGYAVSNGIEKIKEDAEGVVESFKDLIEIIDESNNN